MTPIGMPYAEFLKLKAEGKVPELQDTGLKMVTVEWGGSHYVRWERKPA